MQEPQEMRVGPLGWEDLLEEEMATHLSILGGKSHQQKSLVGYSPQCRKESDTTDGLRMYARRLSGSDPSWPLQPYLLTAHLPAFY